MRRLVQLLLLALAALLAQPALATEGVVLLHGLARSPRSLGKLEAELTRAGFTVVNLGYPSRSAGIERLADDALTNALADPRLQGCTRIHFVTHSMGGILLRSYAARHPLPKLGRVVMLAPPNQGSEVVDRIGHWGLFKYINGPAGQELGTGAEATTNRLGPVPFELGVIAGNRSINGINSLMIDGPDDGKVSVERTKVAGMKEHLVLPVTHPLMMNDDAVIAATLHFLSTGRFHRAFIIPSQSPANLPAPCVSETSPSSP